MIKSGISQVGGKFRLRKTLLEFTPYHEYFLSLFCGSCIYELNKPKANHYECFNDLNPEFANYLIVLKKYRKEFEKKKKQGPYVFVARYLYDLLNQGILTPEDMIEQAVQFHYKIKLSYGSQLKAKFRGIVPETTSKKQSIEKSKDEFKQKVKDWGFKPHSEAIRDKDIKKAKASQKVAVQTNGNFKTNMGKTTRPISNNDCGVLTKLQPEAQQRLKYVILENKDFRDIYDNFFNAFHAKKKLTREVFMFFDPPYPGTEDYYGNLFSPELHQELISRCLKSPFNIMITIGKECHEYIRAFAKAGWIIEPIYTKYSTNANTQDLDREFLIMNYVIRGMDYVFDVPEGLPSFPVMRENNTKTLEAFF